MNRRLSGLTLSLLAVALAGCSMLPDSRKIEYKSAGKAPTLEVPPDLSQITRDDRYLVPDSAGKGSATYSAYSADWTPNGQAQNSAVLPQVDKVRVERSGNQRWLVVSAPADKLWDTVKEFWQETGFIIAIERPEAGVMETDWAENRAKLGNDIIRSTLGRLLDSLYSTGERDKFRTRFEPGATPVTTDVFISHRAMEEVYPSAAKDETRWQPRPADPELEAERLSRVRSWPNQTTGRVLWRFMNGSTAPGVASVWRLIASGSPSKTVIGPGGCTLSVMSIRKWIMPRRTMAGYPSWLSGRVPNHRRVPRYSTEFTLAMLGSKALFRCCRMKAVPINRKLRRRFSRCCCSNCSNEYRCPDSSGCLEKARLLRVFL